ASQSKWSRVGDGAHRRGGGGRGGDHVQGGRDEESAEAERRDRRRAAAARARQSAWDRAVERFVGRAEDDRADRASITFARRVGVRQATARDESRVARAPLVARVLGNGRRYRYAGERASASCLP